MGDNDLKVAGFHAWFKRYGVYSIVFLIALLLIGNIYLIYKNSERIEYHKKVYVDAEKIKVNTVEIIRNLHLLDMALRSYALVPEEWFMHVADSCIETRPLIFSILRSALAGQGFPMKKFDTMYDSMESYMVVVRQMRVDLKNGRTDKFVSVLRLDPGRRAFAVFVPFSKDVETFEDEIARNAQAGYYGALRNSYLLQIILFLVAAPTLAYTAFYTSRSLSLLEKLRASDEKNYRIVAEQNLLLERTVSERTQEIMAQNEEISGQNEEIAAHNEQLLLQQQEIENQRNILKIQNDELQQAKRIIEEQKHQIQIRHDALEEEVDRQTLHLKKTNLELVEQNSRLEQFAYIISHNLRAPMARLIGLSSILEHAKGQSELHAIVKMMVKSTSELDQVIKDLGFILGIQKPLSMLVSEINVREIIEKIVSMLGAEIQETNTEIIKDVQGSPVIHSLQPYVESILFNLISNAIKYRHPERLPVITISIKEETEFLRVIIADNGLGMDMEKNKDNIFSLYKRFHFHVEGKGLGLYLVKTQITMLGGEISVDSKEWDGTTFTLLFKKNNSFA